MSGHKPEAAGALAGEWFPNWNEHLHEHNAVEYQHDFRLFKVVEAYALKAIAALSAAPAPAQQPAVVGDDDSKVREALDVLQTWRAFLRDGSKYGRAVDTVVRALTPAATHKDET